MATITALKAVNADFTAPANTGLWHMPDEPSKTYTPGATITVGAGERIPLIVPVGSGDQPLWGAEGNSAMRTAKVLAGHGGKVVSVSFDTADIVVDYGTEGPGRAWVTVSQLTVLADVTP